MTIRYQALGLEPTISQTPVFSHNPKAMTPTIASSDLTLHSKLICLLLAYFALV